MKFMPFVLLILSACSTFKISMTEQMARSGYNWAVTCIGFADIPFDKIKRVLVNEDHFTVRTKTEEGIDTLLTGLIGFADFEKSSVLVAAPYRDNSRLWAHEYAHLLPKVKDHPDSLFERCNLR